MQGDVHSILALDASPFGESLDLVPPMNCIRAAYPSIHIAVAASAGICELLTSSRLVDKTVSLGAIKPSDRGFGGGLLRFMRLYRSVGGDEVDLVLDFSPRLATMLFGLSRRARILTPSASRRRSRGASPSRRGSRGRRDAAGYGSILSQLELTCDVSTWSPLPAPYESSRFEDYLARSGSKGGEPILLLYTMEAGWSRSWPIRNYAELAVRLASNYGVRVVAADVPYSSDFTNNIAFSLPKGAIKLRSPRAAELVAAVARSSLVVTDDSGVSRMAGSLGTPTIDLSPPSRATGSAARDPANRGLEAVYQKACHLLQASRTGALIRD